VYVDFSVIFGFRRCLCVIVIVKKQLVFVKKQLVLVYYKKHVFKYIVACKSCYFNNTYITMKNNVLKYCLKDFYLLRNCVQLFSS